VGYLYRDKKIGVVIPAYNEEALIGDTLRSVPDYIDKIYVADDCCIDKTPQIIDSFGEKDPRVVHIRHQENRGVGAAIVSGYKRSLEDQMDIAAVMAGDNQMDPTFLPNLLDPIIDGKADYTKGNRLLSSDSRKGMSSWRTTGNFILTFLTKIASGYWQVADPQNGYTAISKRVLETLDLDRVYPWYGYCNDLLIKMNVHGFRVLNVSHPARYGTEKSKIRYNKYILRVSLLLLSGFVWRSKTKYLVQGFHPLVLFYFFGTLLGTIGLFGIVYSSYYKLILGGAIFEKGILSLLIFVIGLQLFLFAMLFDMQQETVR
jgi:glycosyltransferase involved in cell wall biosynthesis